MTVGLSIVLLATGLALRGQTLSYALLDSPSPAPSARFDGPIAYDSTGKQVFLFGGDDNVPRNDLWSYSLEQGKWTEIQTTGAAPPARFGHTLLLDAARRRLIVFGGQAGGFFSDVWAFDIASRAWKQLAGDDAGPTRRYGHSAIYEPGRDRMVISHGFTNAGRFDDTWAFDLGANTWRDLSPSAARPLKRCLHHASYDAERGQMYLYGGCSSGFGPCPQGDLWSFDLATNKWTERTPQPSPAPREHYGMAFDAARAKLVVFGGNGNGLFNDTWEFDPRSNTWQQAAITGNLPSPRSRQEAVYAEDRGTMYFFGGSTGTGLSNELWSLAANIAPKVVQGGVTNVFSGEGGWIAPGEIVSIYGSGLGPTTGIGLSFDAQTGRLPTAAAGVSVTFNGTAAPLYYLQSGQLNVQVPYEVGGASDAKLVVTATGQPSDSVTLPVKATRPGLFPRIWNQNGSVNAPNNAAVEGSVVVIYATGQGVTNPASQTGAFPRDNYPQPIAATTLRIGGVEAEILFRGQAPGTAGVMQINARIPVGTAVGSDVPVLLTVGGVDSQAGVSIAIR